MQIRKKTLFFVLVAPAAPLWSIVLALTRADVPLAVSLSAAIRRHCCHASLEKHGLACLLGGPHDHFLDSIQASPPVRRGGAGWQATRGPDSGLTPTIKYFLGFASAGRNL